MRIALLSDIHGNDVALEAVLDDIAHSSPDVTVCLGDVATLGVQPSDAIQRLDATGCICVRGNHDDFLRHPELIAEYNDSATVRASIEWCRERVSEDDLKKVDTYVDRADLGELFAYHGSPRSNMEELLATTPEDQLDDALAGHTARVFAGGHTHVQMIRQHRGALIVNPGSVGAPFRMFVDGGPPDIMADFAEYAVVDLDGGRVNASLRRVPVDRDRSLAALSRSDNPIAAELLEAWARL